MESVDFVQFGTLTEEDILKLSVCEIVKPAVQGGGDKNRSGTNNTGTPYDNRLGPLENGIRCETCGYDNQKCDGHFGHIVLPIPIFNKIYIDIILQILQSVCTGCARTRLLPQQIDVQSLPSSSGSKKLKAFSKKCEKVIECPWDDCHQPLYKFLFETEKQQIKKHLGDKKDAVVFTAGEALNVFSRITSETSSILGFNSALSLNQTFSSGEHFTREDQYHIHQFRPESLIFTVLPVIPPFSRPYVVRDGQRCDDDLTDIYNSIIKAVIKLREDGKNSDVKKKRNGKLSDVDRQKVESELHRDIWGLMNNKDEKLTLSSGGRPHKCFTERIEGKYGRIQSNIGGKRVDFSARSVIIGGGIYLEMDQLGVPEYVARETTIPEKVTKWNYDYLQSLVHQGKVNRVIRGREVRRINTMPDKGKTFQLIIGDNVERHLQNGDIVVFNRQPSLRVEAFKGFRVLIIKGYAFRLGLCWTGSYNADFDGADADHPHQQGA